MSMRFHLAVFLWAFAAGSGAAEELAGTVSIEECLRVALQEHPQLAAADAEIEGAHQRVRQARSGFLPQVGGQYSVTRQEQTFSSLVGGPTGAGTALGICIGGPNNGALCSGNQNCPPGPPESRCRVSRQVSTSSTTQFTFHRSGFSLSQLLFDFGKTLMQTRAALAHRDAAHAGHDSIEQDVILSVKTAYYNLITARRLLIVAEETETQTRRQLEEARGRYEVGAAPRFDVTQQEVQVADAELARLRARNSLALGRENLRDAMGLTQPIEFEPDDRTLDYRRVELDEARAVERAYDRRPELRDVRARMRAQQHGISALRTDYLPAVSGAGSYSWTGEDGPEDESWLIGANITLSLFNGGRTTAELGEARAALLRLQADERLLRQRVTLEIRRSLLNMREAEDSIRVSEKQVEQAGESLEIAEGRYTAGAGNIIELTDAQVDLSRARANYVRTLADYWISVAALERAVGAPLGGETDHARAESGEEGRAVASRPAPAPAGGARGRRGAAGRASAGCSG
jgi:outer membrane protein